MCVVFIQAELYLIAPQLTNQVSQVNTHIFLCKFKSSLIFVNPANRYKIILVTSIISHFLILSRIHIILESMYIMTMYYDT